MTDTNDFSYALQPNDVADPSVFTAAQAFVHMLSEFPSLPAVFNPWRDKDEEHERPGDMALIRRQHLVHYLALRLARAKMVWVGEALGYRGAHFSGVFFTSERMLLGHHPIITPEAIIARQGERTSRPDMPFIPGKITRTVQQQGFAEVSATLVWRALLDNHLAPQDVLFFSALPFHPYDPKGGYLTNRPPKKSELNESLPLLEAFLKLTHTTSAAPPKLIAIGRIGEHALQTLGYPYASVPHPAQGHAHLFLKGMQAVIRDHHV